MYITFIHMYSNGPSGSFLMIKQVFSPEICYPYVENNESVSLSSDCFAGFALIECFAWRKGKIPLFSLLFEKLGLKWLLQVDKCRIVTASLSTFTQSFIARDFPHGYYCIAVSSPLHTKYLFGLPYQFAFCI